MPLCQNYKIVCFSDTLLYSTMTLYIQFDILLYRRFAFVIYNIAYALVSILQNRVFFSNFTITMTLYIQLDILPNECARRYVAHRGGDAKRRRLSLEQTIKGVYDKIVISTLRTTAYNTTISSRTIPSVFERSPKIMNICEGFN